MNYHDELLDKVEQQHDLDELEYTLHDAAGCGRRD